MMLHSMPFFAIPCLRQLAIPRMSSRNCNASQKGAEWLALHQWNMAVLFLRETVPQARCASTISANNCGEQQVLLNRTWAVACAGFFRRPDLAALKRSLITSATGRQIG